MVYIASVQAQQPYRKRSIRLEKTGFAAAKNNRRKVHTGKIGILLHKYCTKYRASFVQIYEIFDAATTALDGLKEMRYTMYDVRIIS